MTEHIFTNYSDAADALRIKDLKQSLYDDGEVIMDQVLVCLHGEDCLLYTSPSPRDRG